MNLSMSVPVKIGFDDRTYDLISRQTRALESVASSLKSRPGMTPEEKAELDSRLKAMKEQLDRVNDITNVARNP